MPRGFICVPRLLDLDCGIGIHTAKMSAWGGVLTLLSFNSVVA